ncbi:MAG TPA: ribose 5-phosphate isomerase B [Terrimicrobiaceae bacterium]
MSTSNQTSIALGCDEAAFGLKEAIRTYLEKLGHTVEDFGVYNTDPSLYPDIAEKVGRAVADGKHSQAILMCGTGIGMAITANKVPGVRAAVCHDVYSTQRARKSNDCQIMALGARVVGEELAKALVDTWLASSFEGGKSAEKVERIKEIEGHYAKC